MSLEELSETAKKIAIAAVPLASFGVGFYTGLSSVTNPDVNRDELTLDFLLKGVPALGLTGGFVYGLGKGIKEMDFYESDLLGNLFFGLLVTPLGSAAVGGVIPSVAITIPAGIGYVIGACAGAISK